MAKEMTIGIGIGASLSPNFKMAFSQAGGTAQKLGDQLKALSASNQKTVGALEKEWRRLNKEYKIYSQETRGAFNRQVIDNYQASMKKITDEIKKQNDLYADRKGRLERLQGIQERADNLRQRGMDQMFKGRRMIGIAANMYRTGKTTFWDPMVERNEAETSLNRVAQLQGPQFEAVKRNLQNLVLQEKIPQTINSIYKAAEDAYQAGFTGTEVVDLVRKGSKAAAAWQMDMEQATKTIFQIYKMHGSGKNPMSQEELQALIDQTAYVGRITGATPEDLLVAQKKAGLSNKIAGFDAFNQNAVMGSLIQMGMEPQEAVNGFKRIAQVMIGGKRNTKAAQGALKQLGIDPETLAKVSHESGAKGLEMLIQGMRKVADNPKTAYQLAGIQNELFGVRGKITAANLTESAEGLNKIIETATNKQKFMGEAQKQYEISMKSVKNQLLPVQEQLKTVLADIGEGMTPTIISQAGKLNDVLQSFGEFIRNNKKTVESATGIMIKFGEALAAVGATHVAIGLTKTALADLSFLAAHPGVAAFVAAAAVFSAMAKVNNDVMKSHAGATQIINKERGVVANQDANRYLDRLTIQSAPVAARDRLATELARQQTRERENILNHTTGLGLGIDVMTDERAYMEKYRSEAISPKTDANIAEMSKINYENQNTILDKFTVNYNSKTDELIAITKDLPGKIPAPINYTYAPQITASGGAGEIQAILRNEGRDSFQEFTRNYEEFQRNQRRIGADGSR